MQRLIIKNFLNIKSADIVLDGLTVLIGEQASGKSIVAKLFYYFNKYLSDTISSSLTKEEESKFSKKKCDEFYKLFPSYAIRKNNFCIEFEKNGLTIEITSKKNKSEIKITPSEKIRSIHYRMLSMYDNIEENNNEDEKISILNSAYVNIMIGEMFNEFYNDTGDVLLVPAARAFFSNIKDRIFSLLALEEGIDPTLTQFGRFYEITKQSFPEREIHQKYQDIMKETIKGYYKYKDGADFIVSGDDEIELSKSSSGQQEALPLLISLISFPKPNRTLIIEEPEAHLFPSTQAMLLDFIVTQSKKCNILITTHSPYILSSLNNCLIKGTRRNENVDNVTEVEADKIKAYSLKNGESENIMDCDEDIPIISTDYIDSISEEILDNFHKLIEE